MIHRISVLGCSCLDKHLKEKSLWITHILTRSLLIMYTESIFLLMNVAKSRRFIEKLSLRKIAERVGCAHTTVMYELRRGTPDKKPGRGRKPMYSAKRGHHAYLQNRARCRKPLRIEDPEVEHFIQWMVNNVRNLRSIQDDHCIQRH